MAALSDSHPLARLDPTDDSKHISFPAHGSAVITDLILSHDRVISAADDHSIHVYSPASGALLHALNGHVGGVWCIAVSDDGRTLVSGSTDRTLRVWDLTTGRCTHVFRGHTATIRCVAIAENSETVNQSGDGHAVRWGLERPLIVSGSRDGTLRVWKLPQTGEAEYVADEAEDDVVETASDNPYHLLCLEGHTLAIRGVAVQGRVAVSGSYDSTVRVWDIVTGECKWVFTDHTQKVYCVALDLQRNLAYSAGMDATVRVWDLQHGTCKHVLAGHTSLVGLIALSPTKLVSAAADSTLRVFDPTNGELQHILAAHTGAVTCFHHDDAMAVSGSDGALKLWDLGHGGLVRDLLTGVQGVWQVVFGDRWCVAASSRDGKTHLEVWDLLPDRAYIMKKENLAPVGRRDGMVESRL